LWDWYSKAEVKIIGFVVYTAAAISTQDSDRQQSETKGVVTAAAHEARRFGVRFAVAP